MRRWLMIGTLMWVVAALVTRIGIAPPEVCSRPSDGQMATAIDGARDWLIRNQFADGTFAYEYDRVTEELATFDADPNGYNIIRHAGVVMSLYQLAAIGDDDRALPSADRGLDHALGRMIDANGGQAFAGRSDRVDVGASALLLAGLNYRRAATDDPAHDQLIRDLAVFLLAQIGEDGRVLAYFDRATGEPVPDEVSAYYTGEASWALALTREAAPELSLDQPVLETRVLEIMDYLAVRRTTVERTFPPNDDHWAAYTLDEISSWAADDLDDTDPDSGLLNDDHLAYAHRLAGSWSTQTRFDAQRSGVGLARVTRGAKDTGGFHGTGSEGVTALWRLSQNDARFADRRKALTALIECDAGLLVAHQVQSSDPLLDGAWFKGDLTRMDLQQHVLSGLVAARPVLAADDESAPGPALATRLIRIALGALLIAVTLDHRAITARLTTGRHRRTVATVALLAVAVILGLTIAIAGRLLDVARISTTSWFLVAGGWVCLMAIWRLIRRSPEPASSGDPLAGIVPLAFPTVLEPALLSVIVLLAVVLSPADAVLALALAAVATGATLAIHDRRAASERLVPIGPTGPMHHGLKARVPPRGSLDISRSASVLALCAGAMLLTHGIVGLG